MTHSKVFVVLLAAILCAPVVSLAGHDEQGKGKEKHEKHEKHESKKRKGHDDDALVIIHSDRAVIQEYLVNDYHSSCPPGLAKKHNGCMPPGQAKKAYTIGHPLPDVVVIHEVPHDLLVRLRPVPVGYQYVMVDRDVLLVAEATHKVVDAITLLSAVGK